jgi:hypothetical protein
MSQYTSFVAVDESEAGKLTEPARPPRRMLVPVPIPEGTRYEGFFGPARDEFASEDLGFAYYHKASRSHAEKSAAVNGLVRGIYSGRARVAHAAPRAMPARGPAGPPAKPQAVAGGLVAMNRQVPSTPTVMALEMELSDSRADMEQVRGRAGRAYDWYGASTYCVRLRNLAPKALEQAEALRKKGELSAARARFAMAYLLDDACTPYGISDGSISAKALAAIEEIDKELLKAWAKSLPALDKRLDLVIRDKSLAETLDLISKAAEVPVKLIPGSISDACALTGRKDLRVTYLDLRRATVAQALNWTLVPARMTWWLDEGAVVAGTARRRGLESAWAYDVSLLALPSAEEMKKLAKTPERARGELQKSADAFLTAAKDALALKDDAMAWIAPGQLLVFGDAKAHEAAAKLFADMADPNAKLAGAHVGALPPREGGTRVGALAGLHKAACARVAEGKDSEAKRLAAMERAEAVRTLTEHSWPLLAAAAAGELDLEALTELQVAWRSPVMAELLKGGSIAALRSLWAISESARALPKEVELAALAKAADDAASEAAADAVAALGKSQEDPAALFRAIYAALALRDDAAFLSKARPVLAKGKALAPARTVVAALLAPADQIDRKALVELVSKQSASIAGDDMVTLTALACRRAGGEAWGAFRAEARELLGRQPLSGSVVVLVNRLSGPSVPLLATAAK